MSLYASLPLTRCNATLQVVGACTQNLARMKFIVVIALFVGVISCATDDQSGRTGKQAGLIPTGTEKCQSCGVIHQYASTFDDLDYSLIAGFCDEFGLKRQIYWKAPHGPNPACSATYDSDLSWEYLHSEMPKLKRDTFDSFRQRNRPIPTHRGTEDLAEGYGVSIVEDFQGAYQLSRGGFSGNQQQALIYNGSGMIYLFQRSGNKWQQIDSCVLWIP